MAGFGHALWKLGRMIHLSPSRDVSKQECKKKGRKKPREKQARETGTKLDVAGVDLKKPGVMFQMEKQVLEVRREEMRQDLERRVQEQIDQVDSSGARTCEQCGDTMELKERCQGSVKSLYGKLSILYDRLRCRGCKANNYPALEHLGIVPRSWTPFASALLVLLCVLVPFSQARRLAESGTCRKNLSGQGASCFRRLPPSQAMKPSEYPRRHSLERVASERSGAPRRSSRDASERPASPPPEKGHAPDLKLPVEFISFCYKVGVLQRGKTE